MPGKDRVTISLYGVQDGITFNRAALNELSKFTDIKDKLSQSANRCGRDAPEIVISALVIPKWADGSDYKNEDYLLAKKAFFSEFRAALNAAGLDDVILQDFYALGLHEAEYSYLEHLQANGSNADMIKTHALIDPDNEGRRHLQMDSNTQVHDYHGLYLTTFGNDTQNDVLVGLNASYYDAHYVSAHNKIVYTPPDTTFTSKLRDVHISYCAEHKDDHLSEATKKEKTEKNSIYSKDFVIALAQEGLTKPLSVFVRDDKKTIYPATMDRQEYKLSAHVVTAVNMSWKAGEKDHIVECLKTLPSVRVGDATCDYASFAIAAKKQTGSLWMQKYAGKQDSYDQDNDSESEDFLSDDVERRVLLDISNQTVDKAVIIRFYKSAVDHLKSTNPNAVSAPEKVDELTVLAFNKDISNEEKLERLKPFLEADNTSNYQKALYKALISNDYSEQSKTEVLSILSNQDALNAFKNTMLHSLINNMLELRGDELISELFACDRTALLISPFRYPVEDTLYP